MKNLEKLSIGDLLGLREHFNYLRKFHESNCELPEVQKRRSRLIDNLKTETKRINELVDKKGIDFKKLKISHCNYSQLEDDGITPIKVKGFIQNRDELLFYKNHLDMHLELQIETQRYNYKYTQNQKFLHETYEEIFLRTIWTINRKVFDNDLFAELKNADMLTRQTIPEAIDEINESFETKSIQLECYEAVEKMKKQFPNDGIGEIFILVADNYNKAHPDRKEMYPENVKTKYYVQIKSQRKKVKKVKEK